MIIGLTYDRITLQHAWEEATEEIDKYAEDFDATPGTRYDPDYVADVLVRYAKLSDAVRDYLGISTSYSTLDLAN